MTRPSFSSLSIKLMSPSCVLVALLHLTLKEKEMNYNAVQLLQASLKGCPDGFRGPIQYEIGFNSMNISLFGKRNRSFLVDLA